MPASRTDGAGGGYQVDHDDPGGYDFRLHDINWLYPRVMAEDADGMRQAGEGWHDLGQRMFEEASLLRGALSALTARWQSDAAGLFADRVEATAASFDVQGLQAISHAYELLDLSSVVAVKQARMEQLYREFDADAVGLLTPDSSLPAAQQATWVEESRDAPALEVNLRHHTRRALDEVVNPLANRFAESALAFAATGAVFGGPTDAAVPPDAALAALYLGEWLPTDVTSPGAPGVPGLPMPPALPVGLVAAAPTPPATPSTALAAALIRPVPTPATLSSLVGLGGGGAPSLGGRLAPPSLAPTSPGVLPFAAPGPATMLSRGVPGLLALAPPPGPLGHLGTPGHPSVPRLPGLPGHAAPPGPPGTPRLPGEPGRGAVPPPTPQLPGRGIPAAPAGPRHPVPQLPGATRPRGDVPPAPTVQGRPGGTATHPQLAGRGAAPPSTPTGSPPPTLGSRPSTSRRDRRLARGRSSDRPGGWSGHPVNHDPSVPPGLRTARGTSRPVPGPVELPGRITDGLGATGRHTSGSTSSSRGPAGSIRADQSHPGLGSAGRGEPTGPGGRHAAPVDPPTPAEERAADRARRRAEWTDARRGHQRG